MEFDKLLFYFAIGILIALAAWVSGYLARDASAKREKIHCGTLMIDTSDPDGPYMFLNLSIPVEEVISKEEVTFGVEVKDFVSQK